MFRFPRPSLQQAVPSTTASVLLRCLTVCVFICPAAAAGFYLLTAFTEDISTHRREMNAAAYKTDLFRPARKPCCATWVIRCWPATRMHRPQTARACARCRWMVPVASRAYGCCCQHAPSTAAGTADAPLLIDAHGAHWLAGARLTSTWCTCHRCVRCRHAAAASRVQTR
ncbi:hypothetical protein ACE0DR_25720 [Azotobacter sp. CWF10]